MKKHIKTVAAFVVGGVLFGAGLVAADIGPGSWRIAIFDGEGYNNTPLTQHSTSTDELLGGGVGDDGPAWYSFDSAQFSIAPTSVDVGGGFHRKVTLISPSYLHIEGLSENYVSTSTYESLQADVTSLESDVSSMTSQIFELNQYVEEIMLMIATSTP